MLVSVGAFEVCCVIASLNNIALLYCVRSWLLPLHIAVRCASLLVVKLAADVSRRRTGF